jgi:hypothetical protein
MLAAMQFTVIISVIDVVMYITTLAYGRLSTNPNNGFLAPTEGTLYLFGEKVSYSQTPLFVIKTSILLGPL